MDEYTIVNVAKSTGGYHILLGCPRCAALITQDAVELHESWHDPVEPKTEISRTEFEEMFGEPVDERMWEYLIRMNNKRHKEV